MHREGCRHGLRFRVPFCRGKGWGRESPGDIGFRDGPVEVCFLGRVLALVRVEVVEYYLVVGADIKGDKMVVSIVPRAATYGYG